MATTERGANDEDRAFEWDASDAGLGIEKPFRGFPLQEDIEDGENARWAWSAVGIGVSGILAVVAYKKYRDGKKGS